MSIANLLTTVLTLSSKTHIIICILITLSYSCLTNYEYYNFISNECQPCSTSCLTCLDQTICVACVDQYYLDQNQNICKLCQYGCSVCSDQSNCTSCQSGLYLNGEGNCIACAIGVQSCTIAVIESCLPQYFMLGDICAGCLSNCDECVDFATCTQCSAGYYLSADTTQCLECSANCLTCSNVNTCTACTQGYQVNPTGSCSLPDCSTVSPFCIKCSFGYCIQCSRGKYTNQNGGCTQGASILCLESTGPYHTNCQTSNFGCPLYAEVQKDIYNGNQLDVCLPVHASTSKQQVYYKTDTSCPVQSCSTVQSSTWNLNNLKPFFKLSYYISVKLYSSATHQLTLNIIQNTETLSIKSISASATTQFSQGLTDTTSCSQACQYGIITLNGQLTVSAKKQIPEITLTSTTSGLVVLQAVIITNVCTVDKCQLCSSSVDCLSCLQPYYLQLIQCVSACDPGFYLYGRKCVLSCPTTAYPVRVSYTCIDCQSPCKTCTSQSQCLSCVDGYYLEDTFCLVACSTAELFTNLTSYKCQACPNPCTQCQIQYSSDNSSQWSVICLACRVGYVLINGSCTYICPDGAFAQFIQDKAKCSICSVQCTQCFIQSNICSACQPSYLLNIQTSFCADNYVCPDGYFQNTVINICQKCHYPCKTCNTIETNCTSCLKGALYQNNCPLECPSQYYSLFQSESSTCMPCVSPCITCLSQSLCLTCQSNTFLHENSCFATCPLETLYELSSNSSCMPCLPPCSKCNSQQQCLSCSTGFIDLSTNRCTLQCNQSSYVNTNFQCTLCPTPCAKCYSSTNCFKCQLPFVIGSAQDCMTQTQCQNLDKYVLYQYDYSTGTPQHISSVCVTCTYPCAACSGSPILCTSCATSYYLISQLQTCAQQCPLSYYQNGIQCSRCDSNCLDCQIQADNCTLCGTGMFLYSNTCIQQCPQFYYGDNSQCKPCQSPCLECYNVYLCKSCQTNSILYNKICIDACPSGTVHNIGNNQCDICTNGCLTCSVQSDNCTSCANQLYYHVNQCLATCPDQYYGDTRSQACQSCIQPCNLCASDTSCLSCIATYFIHTDQCLLQCPIGYFKNTSQSICQQCNTTTCKSCSTTSNNCTSCLSPYYYDTYISNTCVLTCPSSTYKDNLTRTCKSCRFPCSQCTSINICQACHNNYKLFNSYCYSACPVGYYHQTVNDLCEPCTVNCQICSSQTICQKCVTNYYSDQNSQCVRNCEIGYYPTFDTLTSYPVCLQCPPQCSKCTQYYQCTACTDTLSYTLYLFNGICLDQCPIMHYSEQLPAVTPPSYICNRCSQNCNKCTNQTNCIQCLNSYMYTSKCFLQCPSTTYMFNAQVCINCSPPCFQCIGQYSCLTCQTGYFYYQNYCLNKCPQDVWTYPQNNTCNTQCPYNKYQLKKQCYVSGCGGMMVQLNGYCLQKCPSDYYVDIDQNCQPCSSNSQICSNLFVGNLKILRSSSLKLALYFTQPISPQKFNIDNLQVTFTDINDISIKISYSHKNITIDAYKLIIQYSYQPIYLYQISLKTPYIQSVSSLQSINNNHFIQTIYSYNDYSQQNSITAINAIALVFVVLTFICIVINIVVKSSVYFQLLDLMQFIAASLYLQIQYPPVLQGYLSSLGYILWTFAPDVIDSKPYSISPSKYIEYFIDTSLLRSYGLPLIIFILFFITFVILIIINHFKPQYLDSAIKRIRYRHLTDIFSIFMLPLLVFSFHFSNSTIIDILFSIVIILLSVSYIVLITYKLITAKSNDQIPGLAGDLQQLSDASLGKLYTPFAFLRKLIFALVLCIQPDSPISTLTILLVLTILIMVCLLFYQPFQNIITDYICIFMQIILCIYIVMIILLGLNIVKNNNANILGIVTIVISILGILGGLVWLCYLTVNAIKKYYISIKQQKQANQIINKQNDNNNNRQSGEVIDNNKHQSSERNSNNIQQSAYSQYNTNLIKVHRKQTKNQSIHQNDIKMNENNQSQHYQQDQPSANQLILKNKYQYHQNQQFRHWNASDSQSQSNNNNKNKNRNNNNNDINDSQIDQPPMYLMKVDRK